MRYLYRCDRQHVTEKICPASLYEEAVPCDECDLVAVRVFTPPLLVSVKQDIGYESPIDGRVITSWQAREEDMKRHHCIEYDPEMKTDVDRRRNESQRQLDAAIDDTVSESIAKMSTKERGKLYSEVTEQGMDCHVIRR